jgi:hypothetical protein
MTPNQPLQHAALDHFRSKLLSVTQGNDKSAISQVLDASSPPCTGYKCQPMERGFIFVRLGIPAINKLIKPFADSFFPGLIQYVNQYADQKLVETAQSGSCCDWGDFGVKASAWVQGFYLNSIGENQITLTTVPPAPPVPSQSVVVNLRASNLSAGFRSVGVSAGFACGFPVNCRISCQANVTIPALEISAELQLLDDGVTFRITPVGASLPNLSILLVPDFDNVCSVLAAPIVAVFGELGTLLTDIALPFLQGVIFDGVKSLICPNGACPEISIPAIPPIVINAGQLNVYPDLQRWAGAPGEIMGNGLGHFQSTLSSPAWRAGRSHLTPLGTSAGIETPVPTIDNMASISIGSVGASAFIDNLWYLVWATLATDARGGESGLCTATNTDPCPFPPIVTSVAAGDPLFTALSAIFIGHGPYSSFETSVLLPSPSVRFETGGSAGSIKGMQTANMLVRGLSDSKSDLLATVSAPYSLDAAVPKYDAATGIFSGLEISNPVFDSPAVTFPGQPPLQDLVKQLLDLAAAGLTTVAGMLVPLLNNAIAKALANTPLKIPAIEGVPLAGQTLHIDLATASARGVSSPGENLQSYLKVDASVTVTVSGQPDPPGAPLSSRKGEESEKSIRDTVIETAARWAKDSNNPNASFSSFYSGPDVESEARTVYGGA